MWRVGHVRVRRHVRCRRLPRRPPRPASNVLELTVGELSGALKRTIEDRFGFVRVRGEISNYRGPHSSGHAYFSLKDDAARIDAVIWRTSFQRLKVKPQEGLEVIATGASRPSRASQPIRSSSNRSNRRALVR